MLSQRRLLLLDGAMGTELQRRGCAVELPLWSAHALFDSPELVAAIHHDYLRAGADVLTTNTFRTTPRTFHRAGIPDRSQALTAIAVMLAHEARARCEGRTVLIAGSMAPLEDCYHPELVPPDDALRAEHRQHAMQLAAAGVDFLLVETMATIREARAACAAACETGKEAVVSFLCDATGNLYSGESLADAVRAITPLQPAAFSINCVAPRYIAPALSALRVATDLPVAVYANVGMSGHEQPQRIVCDIHPDEYAAFASEWIREGVTIVGGCCGTTPEHIQALHDLLSSPQTAGRSRERAGESVLRTGPSTRTHNIS
jgi:S-methylmethionine-dependent homocysteine/selenocysteine methylase